MKASSVQPYLFFAGRCDEAIAFYRAAVGAELEMLMRFDQSPQPLAPGSIPEGFGGKVMHAALRIGDGVVLASDGTETTPRFGGFSLSLTLGTADEARRAFGALSEGGEVTLPMSPTFWSPCFGMLKDRFGVHWMVGVAPTPAPAAAG